MDTRGADIVYGDWRSSVTAHVGMQALRMNILSLEEAIMVLMHEEGFYNQNNAYDMVTHRLHDYDLAVCPNVEADITIGI